MNTKKARPIRLGDLIRTMWKVKDKTKGKCLQCDWTAEGIGYPNACREARKHTRETGHVTRVASVEIIEYRTGS
jgi:hypothetical protein